MCGRYVMGLTLDAFKQQFAEYQVSLNLPEPNWNIKPTDPIPILLEDHKQPGHLRAEPARWSLTPPWSPTLNTPYPTFNARTEHITEKPTWSTPLKTRRCIIPTTGFYEWSGPKGNRTPHYIYGPQPTLNIAGLYGWWKDDTGHWHLTATMLTQQSTGMMASIHHRMPVFIDDSHTQTWLTPSIPGTQTLVDTITKTSEALAAELHEYAVRPLRGNGPKLIEPIE